MDKAILLLSVTVFTYLMFFIIFRRNVKRKSLKAFGLFLLIVFLVCLASASADPISKKHPLFTGITSTLQVFSLDADFEMILFNLFQGHENILLRIYVEGVLSIAPIAGGAAVLTVISDIFPIVKYRLKGLYSKKLIIFSSLNDQSYMMAEELIATGKVDRLTGIVFCNTLIEEENKVELNLLERAKDLNASVICLRKGLTEISLPRFAKADLYFVRDIDMKNIEEVILYTSVKKEELSGHKKKIRIFVFAQGDLGPEIMEHVYNNVGFDHSGRFDITVIPYKTNAIYRQLLETPLFKFFNKPYNEKELFQIVVTGDNEWAVEIIKACFWCCQLPGKDLSIISFSENSNEFSHKISSLIPGIDIKQNNYCTFAFYDTDKYGAEIDSFIKNESPIPSIWFVAGDTDRDTLELGKRINEMIGYVSWQNPFRSIVLCRIENDDLSDAVNKNYNDSEKIRKKEETDKIINAPGEDGCILRAFASLKDQYSPSCIYDELSDLAWMLDENWARFFKGGDKNVLDSEYNRRSSRASALHILYKMYALGLDDGTNHCLSDYIRNNHLQDGLSETDLKTVGVAEHKRWNAYLLTERYKSVDVKEWIEVYKDENTGISVTKDRKKRLHVCLTESDSPSKDLTEYLRETYDSEDDILRKLSKADRDYADHKIDELDRVSVYLYNNGYKYGQELKKYDEESIDNIIKYHLLYEGAKQLNKSQYYSVMDDGEIDIRIKRRIGLQKLAEDIIKSAETNLGTRYTFKAEVSKEWSDYLTEPGEKYLIEFIKKLYAELEPDDKE